MRSWALRGLAPRLRPAPSFVLAEGGHPVQTDEVSDGHRLGQPFAAFIGVSKIRQAGGAQTNMPSQMPR